MKRYLITFKDLNSIYSLINLFEDCTSFSYDFQNKINLDFENITLSHTIVLLVDENYNCFTSKFNLMTYQSFDNLFYDQHSRFRDENITYVTPPLEVTDIMNQVNEFIDYID